MKRRFTFAGNITAILFLIILFHNMSDALANDGPTPNIVSVSIQSANNIWMTGSSSIAFFTTKVWDGKNITDPPGFPQKVPAIPFPDTQYATGQGVVAISKQEAWVIASGTGNIPLQFFHYFQGTWTREASPAFQGAPITWTVTAMNASTAHDVWAAACESTSAGVRQGFFLHWNGQGWKRIDPPRIVHRDVCFSSIKATNTEVIAVGTSGNGNDLTDGRPLIERWNGAIWQIVSYPSVKTSFTIVQTSIVNEKNIWAIRQGASYEDIKVKHWNGAIWQDTRMPQMPAGHIYQIQSIDVANGDQWVVGQDLTLSEGESIPLALHWSGRVWVSAKLPLLSDEAAYSNLFAVKVFSIHNVIVIGKDSNGILFLEHWDGHSWTIQGQQSL